MQIIQPGGQGISGGDSCISPPSQPQIKKWYIEPNRQTKFIALEQLLNPPDYSANNNIESRIGHHQNYQLALGRRYSRNETNKTKKEEAFSVTIEDKFFADYLPIVDRLKVNREVLERTYEIKLKNDFVALYDKDKIELYKERNKEIADLIQQLSKEIEQQRTLKEKIKALGHIELTEEIGMEQSPYFSPDGKWVVYEGPRGICKVKSDGSKKTVHLASVDGFLPAWSLDGNIYFTAGFDSPRRSIFRIPSEIQKPYGYQEVLENIVAEADKEYGWLQILFLPNGEMVSIKGDGAYIINGKKLLDHGGVGGNPSFSPDLKEAISATGLKILYKQSLTDGTITEIKPQGPEEAKYRCTKWNKGKIITIQDINGKCDLVAMNLDGSDLEKITNDGLYKWDFDISPDEKYAAVSVHVGGKERANLYLYSLEKKHDQSYRRIIDRDEIWQITKKLNMECSPKKIYRMDMLPMNNNGGGTIVICYNKNLQIEEKRRYYHFKIDDIMKT